MITKETESNLEIMSKLPLETDEGSITIDGNVILVKSLLEHYRIQLDSLYYVSIMVYQVEEKREASLCLVDRESEDYFKKKYIPLHFLGFSIAWEKLQSLININNKEFVRALSMLHSGKIIDPPFEYLLWRKVTKQNYQILSAYPNDYKLGFEIFGPAPAFIHWNDTANLKSRFSDLVSNNETKTIYPVRLGNIEFKDCIRVEFWSEKLYLPGRGSECYFSLKEALIDLTRAKEFTAHENEEKKSYYLYIRSAPLTFRLHYPFGEAYELSNDYFRDPDLVVFSLEIDPPKNYSDVEIKQIKVDGVIALREDVRLNFYDTDPDVFELPEMLKKLHSSRPIIWVDYQAARVGFSDGNLACYRSLKSFESFTIYNFVRGPGESARLCIDLEVMMDCKDVVDSPFVEIALQLEELTGKEVVVMADVDSGY